MGASLDAAAVLWAELPWNNRIPDVLNDLEFSNFLLLPSMVALLASSVLFFTRWFSNQASRTRFEPMGAVQSTFLLFRRHHRLLGWLALAFAGAHSVYFLLFPGATFAQWTGIAATALLVVVGLLGLITSYNTFFVSGRIASSRSWCIIARGAALAAVPPGGDDAPDRPVRGRPDPSEADLRPGAAEQARRLVAGSR